MTQVISPETLTCPYPGLRHFRREEALVFFGRDEQVDQLLERLGRSRFLAVVGSSGCGKSSLVRAGLIPALETGLLAPAGARWAVATMRPGDQPLRNLVDALLDDGVLGPAKAGVAHAAEFRLADLRRGPLGLAEVLVDTPLPGGKNLLLLVDQFEEIFRFRTEGRRDEADAFVALLLASAAQPDVPIHVVLTMRSDYLGDCALFAGLPEALNGSQFLTPRLSRDQRRQAIEGPAAVFDGSVEDALVNRLLNDMGTGPDQLPLMQHALMRLWKRASPSAATTEEVVLRLVDYEAIGGLEAALSRHADEIFGGLEEDQRAIAEAMFRLLGERGIEGRDTRRPTELRAIAEVAGVAIERVRPVVEAFRHPDLSVLMPPPPTPLEPETVLDISHESLIRQWGRLQGWVEHEASSAEMYRRLAQTAALWGGRKAGLWGTPDLELALDWKDREQPNAAWARRYGGDFGLAMRFLRESEQRREANRAAEAKRQIEVLKLAQRRADEAERRRKEDAAEARRLRFFVIALTVAVALVAVLAGVALVLRDRANKAEAAANSRALEVARAKIVALDLSEKANRAEAEAASKALETTLAQAEAKAAADKVELQKRITTAAQLTYEYQLVHEKAPVLGLLLAVEAMQATMRVGEPPLPTADQILRQTLTTIGGRGLYDPGSGIRDVLFRPDGHRMVALNLDGTVSEWELNDPVPKPVPLFHHDAGLEGRAISPDGRWLAAIEVPKDGPGNHDREIVRVVDLENPGAKPIVPQDQEGSSSTLALSRDGRWLAIGGRGDLVRLYQLDSATPKPTLLHCKDAGEPDGPVQTNQSGETSRLSIQRLTFSPDGRWLAATLHRYGLSDQIKVFDLANLRATPSTGFVGGNRTLAAFSRDGRQIAVGSDEGVVRVFDLTHPRDDPIELLGHKGRITALAFGPDGRLASGSEDQIVRVWDAGTATKFRGEEGPSYGLAFSPDGRRLTSWGGDGMRVFELSEPFVQPIIRRHPGEQNPTRFDRGVVTLEITADGKRLISGDGDGTTLVWDLNHLDAQPVVLPREKDGVRALATSADDRRLVVGRDDRSLIVTDQSTPDVESQSIQPVGAKTVTLQVFDLNDLAAPPTVLSRSSDSMAALAIDSEGRLLMASATGAVWTWDLNHLDAEPVPLLRDPDTRAAAISHDGRWLVTQGVKDRSTRVWDLHAKTSRRIDHPPYVVGLLQAGVSRDSRWLATAWFSGWVRVWELRTPTNRPFIFGGSSPLAISPDGRSLAVDAEQELSIWSLDDPTASRIILPKRDASSMVLAIDPSNRWLIEGCLDKTIRFWLLRPDELIALAGRTAGRNFTFDEWEHYFPRQPYRPTFPDLPVPKFDERYGSIARNLTPTEWQDAFPGLPYRKTFPDRPVPPDGK
jgi:WD40 repeat protein